MRRWEEGTRFGGWGGRVARRRMGGGCARSGRQPGASSARTAAPHEQQGGEVGTLQRARGEWGRKGKRALGWAWGGLGPRIVAEGGRAGAAPSGDVPSGGVVWRCVCAGASVTSVTSAGASGYACTDLCIQRLRAMQARAEEALERGEVRESDSRRLAREGAEVAVLRVEARAACAPVTPSRLPKQPKSRRSAESATCGNPLATSRLGCDAPALACAGCWPWLPYASCCLG